MEYNGYLIGQRIRAAREIKGISQKELAKNIGLSQSALSRIELGTTDVSLRMIYRISEILEKDLSWFWQEELRFTTEDQKLITEFGKFLYAQRSRYVIEDYENTHRKDKKKNTTE